MIFTYSGLLQVVDGEYHMVRVALIGPLAPFASFLYGRPLIHNRPGLALSILLLSSILFLPQKKG